jgi:hypothetical protein
MKQPRCSRGQRYAADPPTVDEIIAVMRHATHARYVARRDRLALAEIEQAGDPRLAGKQGPRS